MSMVTHRKPPMAVATSLLFIGAFVLLISLYSTEAQVGVCYGRLGNNLPCAQDVVNLYEKYGIGAMRLYEPDQPTLEALQYTDIKLMLGVHNQDIPCIASDQSTADDWVQNNVIPYATNIKYIAVGNEIQSSFPEASSVEPAMQNLLNALNSNDLGSQIKISTAIDTKLIENSYPPSQTKFKNLTYITPIINFLTINESPLLVNIEPYAAYVDDKNIQLDYALFTTNEPVNDTNGKQYYNLYDAIYDAVYIAVQKVVTPCKMGNSSIFDGIKANKKTPLPPVTSESGWPSSGGFPSKSKINDGRKIGQRDKMETTGPKKGLPSDRGNVATPENAKTYYNNLINHIKQGKGTPLNPGQKIETYLFAMFDENQKPGDGSEQHYGLFNPVNEQPKYGNLSL